MIRERMYCVSRPSDEARRIQSGSNIFDLKGRDAFPGFIDSHVHYWRSGLMDQMVDLRGVRSIGEIQLALRDKAGTFPRDSC